MYAITVELLVEISDVEPTDDPSIGARGGGTLLEYDLPLISGTGFLLEEDENQLIVAFVHLLIRRRP